MDVYVKELRMMDNISQHLTEKPILIAILAISLLVVMSSIPYFINQKRLYGTMFQFASTGRKFTAGLSAIALGFVALVLLTPYTPPPSTEIAIVIGNTQNTPTPSLTSEISDTIESTMLLYKGKSTAELKDGIKVISAVKEPEVINFSTVDLNLKDIGLNNSNAKRDASINIQEIEGKIKELTPNNNGANYLEAIIAAKNNIEKGSKIIVIGSGLSDSGDLNFSKNSILTNSRVREEAIDNISDKYSSTYLEDYHVEFYGLGDTTDPQMALSSVQKDLVRSIYEEAITRMGGSVSINTSTLAGPAVKTTYLVGTTDTGCGDVKLIFDDEDLKFIPDQAAFIDEVAAMETLSTIRELWDNQRDMIELIQIDGYTAHYPGAETLSQERADTVKSALSHLGVPTEKMNATGQGYGPYEEDSQNRKVNVNISRNNQQCSN